MSLYNSKKRSGDIVISIRCHYPAVNHVCQQLIKKELKEGGGHDNLVGTTGELSIPIGPDSKAKVETEILAGDRVVSGPSSTVSTIASSDFRRIEDAAAAATVTVEKRVTHVSALLPEGGGAGSYSNLIVLIDCMFGLTYDRAAQGSRTF